MNSIYDMLGIGIMPIFPLRDSDEYGVRNFQLNFRTKRYCAVNTTLSYIGTGWSNSSTHKLVII